MIIETQTVEQTAALQQPQPLLRVFMLGRFVVQQGERLIESEHWRSRKARNLFKILLSRRNFRLTRQEAVELLWPDLDPEKSANNLYQAIYSLRRTLQPGLERGNVSVYLRTEGTKIELNSELIGWVDLDEFNRLYRRAQLTRDLSLYEQAVALHQGEYLPEDLYEDWSIYRREALREDWIELLLQMAALYRERGSDDRYQRCLNQILESDFSHEETIQKLMRVLAEHNRREEAMAFYHNFVLKLSNRLNLEPLPETRQLYTDIAAGKVISRPGLSNLPSFSASSLTVGDETSLPKIPTLLTPLIFPVFSTVYGPPRPVEHQEEKLSTNNLESVTRLVGRLAEQQSWQNWLGAAATSGKSMLYLLQGEAGVGKTNLSLELARQAQQANFEVFQLTCHSQPAELAFSLVSQWLEQLTKRLTPAQLEECLTYCHSSLSRLLPGRTTNNNDNQAVNTGLAPMTLALSQLLTWLEKTYRRPLLLVLDDLHHLPDASLKLLYYLLTNYTFQPPLLVLATSRPLARRFVLPELGQLLDWATETNQVVCRLERFGDKQELNQLIRQHFEQPLDAEALDRIYVSSQGNPALALKLVRAYHEENYLPTATRKRNEAWREGEREGKLPQSVLTYAHLLLNHLSREAQILLSLAALVATPAHHQPVGLNKVHKHSFGFETLREIIMHHRDGAGWWIDLDKTHLGLALLELADLSFIEEDGLQYRFAYPMLAEALRQNLPPRQLHCWQQVITQVRQKEHRTSSLAEV